MDDFIEDTNKKWYDLVGKLIPSAKPETIEKKKKQKKVEQEKVKLKKEKKKLQIKPTVIPKKIKTVPINKKYPVGTKGKPFKKAGGSVKNRNMGGVIGGGLASKDVNDYLYKYNS